MGIYAPRWSSAFRRQFRLKPGLQPRFRRKNLTGRIPSGTIPDCFLGIGLGTATNLAGRITMRYRLFLAFVLAAVCRLPLARAVDFTSPEGFSVTYPDTWKGLTPKDVEKVEARTKKAGVPSPLVSNPQIPLTLIHPKGKLLSPSLIVMNVEAAPFHMLPGLAENRAAQMK